ncbi:MAG: hypothetical protein QGH40_09070, partial [bacterium]|nr:hypothetical protein [bacterium]
MEHNNTAANWATLMNAVRKTLYCSLLILVILPVGCAPRPKIGLTDTVYFQLRQVLEKKLNAAAVDLVTDNSMKAYFNGIENGVIESSKIKILTYKPYDINIWKMYHWVDQYEGLQTT